MVELRGQDTALFTLRRALQLDRVPHAYLFDGPDGVGKEVAAFLLAQALVCETRAPRGDRGCGTCSACTRALLRKGERRPRHPDIIVLERGLYEPAQIGRRTPETQDLSIDQIRTLVLARSAFAPHEGRARVFILRRPEELSISAANALLKTLEEPGKNVHFILLSAQPDSLLPTILSRTQRVRFGHLPADVVRDLLIESKVDAERAKAIAPLAGGSMAIARVLADDDAVALRSDTIARVTNATTSKTIEPLLGLAEDAKKNREGLEDRLRALMDHFAQVARAAVTDGKHREALRAANAHQLALTAMLDLDKNASPQHTIESMMLRIRSLP